jgi:hypothetical protein
VVAGASAVPEQLPVLATGVLKRVGQHGEPVRIEFAAGKLALVVGCSGQVDHVSHPPGWGDDDGTKKGYAPGK